MISKLTKRIKKVGTIEEITITTLFIDIVHYTQFTNKNTPTTIYKMLSDFYRIVEIATEKNNGKLTEVAGDATLSHFRNPKDALKTGLDLQKELEKIHKTYGLKARMSINTGLATKKKVKAHKSKFNTVVGFVQIMGQRLLTLGEPESIILLYKTAKDINHPILEKCKVKKGQVKGIKEPLEYIEITKDC